jgi:hypothetical protein
MNLCARDRIVAVTCIEVTGEERNGLKISATLRNVMGRCSDVTGEEHKGMRQ